MRNAAGQKPRAATPAEVLGFTENEVNNAAIDRRIRVHTSEGSRQNPCFDQVQWHLLHAMVRL